MQPKVKKNWLNEMLDDLDRRKGQKVRSRWYIVEITPSQMYWRGDGHGGSDRDWTNTKVERVSQYFNSHQEAKEFMDRHRPDDGKTLEVRIDSLYRRTVEEWYAGD